MKKHADVQKPSFPNRALELDLLRGIAVLLMILDHLFFDLFGLLPQLFEAYPEAVSSFARSYWHWDVRVWVRMVVLFVFFGLTGLCSSFSRSNIKRGCKLLAVAMLLTVGTFVAGKVTGERDLTIVFGVLHCIAVSLLLLGLTQKLHWNKWAYLIVGLVLWGIGLGISFGTTVPLIRYGEQPFPLLLGKSVLGLAMCGSDCFALPETCGQIFVGMFLGMHFYADRSSRFGWKYRNTLLSFFGRHSLWVYFAHQLLIPPVASLVLICFGYSFSA